jgi:hypothetical protein
MYVSAGLRIYPLDAHHPTNVRPMHACILFALESSSAARALEKIRRGDVEDRRGYVENHSGVSRKKKCCKCTSPATSH